MATRPTTHRASGRTRAPARWLLQIGVDHQRAVDLKRRGETTDRNNYLHAQRARKLFKLREQLLNVRQYYRGFESRDGYNLNDIKSWPARRVSEIEKYGTHLAQIQSQPHDRLVPRNAKQKRALEVFTGETTKRQRAWAVHKPSDLDFVRINKNGNISIERNIASGKLKSDFYLFYALLGYQPQTWDDVYAATAELLPYMPADLHESGDELAKYYIYSSQHGEIDAPQFKRMLLRVIMRYRQEYGQKDFARTIIGFKKISDEITPNAEYARIVRRRQEHKDKQKKQRDALYKQMHRVKLKKRDWR